MGHFYYIRHGQAVWNVEDKICGVTDSPLTELGHWQAIETGRRFLEQGLSADEILYSPLSRAADTARHISEITGLPARVEPRLIEQNFGRFEGTPRGTREFLEAKRNLAFRSGFGESMLQVAQRIYNLLDELKAQPERTRILVAHNGVSRVVQSYFREMDNETFAAYAVANCEIIRYDF